MAAITIRNEAARDIRVSVPISLGGAQQDGGYYLLTPGQESVWNRPASGNNEALGATAFVVGTPFVTGSLLYQTEWHTQHRGQRLKLKVVLALSSMA